jgi:hypothetical protein
LFIREGGLVSRTWHDATRVAYSGAATSSTGLAVRRLETFISGAAKASFLTGEPPARARLLK